MNPVQNNSLTPVSGGRRRRKGGKKSMKNGGKKSMKKGGKRSRKNMSRRNKRSRRGGKSDNAVVPVELESVVAPSVGGNNGLSDLPLGKL